MNKQAAGMVKLANEDVKNGHRVSAYIDGPGWVLSDRIEHSPDDDLVVITLPAGAGFYTFPGARLAAIRAAGT